MHWTLLYATVTPVFVSLLLLPELLTGSCGDPIELFKEEGIGENEECIGVNLYEPTAREYTEIVAALRRRLKDLYAAEVNVSDSQLAMHRLSRQSWRVQLSATTLWSVTLHPPNKSVRSAYFKALRQSQRVFNASLQPLIRNAVAVVFKPPEIHEYFVGPLPNPTGVKLVRVMSYLKRPLGSVEYGALVDFLTILCAEIDEVLRVAYSASFFVKQPSMSWFKMDPNLNRTPFKRMENKSLCQPTESHQNGVNGQPSCLIPIFASPIVTGDSPGRRRTCFRLVRQVAPLIQYPVDTQFIVSHLSSISAIDHTSLDPLEWRLQNLWFQHRFFNSSADLMQTYRLGQLKISKLPFVDLYPGQLQPKFSRNTSSLTPTQLNETSSEFTPNLPSSSSSSCQDHLRQSVEQPNNGKKLGQQKQRTSQKIKQCRNYVRYKHWEFFFTMRRDTGLRVYDVRFYGHELVAEAGLDETVTAYWGTSPFMQKMTSVESMFGVGAMASELSPGLDCPKDAIFIPVTLVPSGEVGPRLIKQGVCLFEWSVDSPGGPTHRHFEFPDHSNPATGGSFSTEHVNFGHGVPSRGLVVRMISSLFNYDYIFDILLHSSGVVEFAVTPTGYIHLHNQRHKWFDNNQMPKVEDERAFGYLSNMFEIGFTVHQHLFNFKVDVDVIQENNVFKVVDILGPMNSPEEPPQGALWIVEKVIHHEADALITPEFDKPKKYLICESNSIPVDSSVDSLQSRNPRCLSLVNSGAVKTLLSNKHTKSFAWSRHTLVVTRQRDNETFASTPFNGVDLTNPVLDFTAFSANNESLYGEDLVLWVTMGNYHLPRQEDLPNTVTSGGRLSFRLIPHNLFQYSPDAFSCQRFFTKSDSDTIMRGREDSSCVEQGVPIVRKFRVQMRDLILQI